MPAIGRTKAMTNYTLRDAATMESVAASEETLEAAVDHMDCERIALLLDSPPEPRELEFVITPTRSRARGAMPSCVTPPDLQRDSRT